MDHETATELFSAYHDGDLDATATAELEAHLSNCSRCNEEWQIFQRTVTEVSGLLQFAPPEDLARSVETRIRKRSRGKFFGRQKNDATQFALVSFILILLFMTAYLLLTAVTEITIIDHQKSDKDVPSDGGSSTSLLPAEDTVEH